MISFFQQLMQYPFLQVALAGGLLASVASGVVGSYVVVRRVSYIAAGIAHCVLAGMGAAYYLQRVHGLTWLEPIYGAVATALVSAWLIGWISLRAKQWEDTIIGAIWAVGMAAGVLFIHATPGYGQDLFGYLFGNILFISGRDLVFIAVLDIVVVGVGLGLYRPLTAVCFDEEFARTRGLHVEAYYLLLLTLAALTVVLLVWVVGVVMVIAMLSIPVAVAGVFVRRLWMVMILAALLTAALTAVGFALGFVWELPTGATIVVLAGLVYLVVMGIKALRSRWRN